MIASPRPPAFVLGMIPMGLAVARALGREGIRVVGFEHVPPGAPRPPGFSSRYVTGVPCPDPARDPEALVTLLAACARRERTIPVLLYTDDVYVSFVDRHREALSGFLRFAISPPDVAAALVDKRKQHDLAVRGGLPCPRTFFPESHRDVVALQHDVEYPALVKPCVSHEWRERYRGQVMKGFRADSPEQLVAYFDEAFAAGFPVIVQSVVQGAATDHLKICAYVGRNGDVLATYTGRRLRQYPTQFGNGTLCESAPAPDVEAAGLAFLSRIGYRGYANIEMMRDERDGQLRFIEINGRPGSSHAILAASGVNTSLVEYLDLAGLPQRPVGPERYGVRWWILPEDLMSFAWSRRRGELTTLRWIRSWARARSFATFASDDPLPLRWYAARLARAVRRGARVRLRRRWWPAVARGAPADAGRAT